MRLGPDGHGPARKGGRSCDRRERRHGGGTAATDLLGRRPVTGGRHNLDQVAADLGPFAKHALGLGLLEHGRHDRASAGLGERPLARGGEGVVAARQLTNLSVGRGAGQRQKHNGARRCDFREIHNPSELFCGFSVPSCANPKLHGKRGAEVQQRKPLDPCWAEAGLQNQHLPSKSACISFCSRLYVGHTIAYLVYLVNINANNRIHWSF
ncbi:MAG: hypothetical protein KBD66_01180 [Candidatus Doudnabacteria bacterium]|nr:hypothetical protein [Candidatus Doudnabacteria bacterium]